MPFQGSGTDNLKVFVKGELEIKVFFFPHGDRELTVLPEHRISLLA